MVFSNLSSLSCNKNYKQNLSLIATHLPPLINNHLKDQIKVLYQHFDVFLTPSRSNLHMFFVFANYEMASLRPSSDVSFEQMPSGTSDVSILI